MPSLILFFMLLSSMASAQTYKFVNIPLCFPPYNPPVTELRIYEDNAVVASVKPFWAPTGGIRSSIFYYGKVGSIFSFTVVRDGKESSKSTAKSGVSSNNCWKSGVVGPSQHVGDFKGPSERVVDMPKDCYNDPACGQFLLNNCLKDPICEPSVCQMTQIDWDQDGSITQSDVSWCSFATHKTN